MRASLIVSLAFRNLTRNVRRTLITSAAVIAGVSVLIMGFGLVDGLDENVIRAQEDTSSAMSCCGQRNFHPTTSTIRSTRPPRSRRAWQRR